MDVVEIEALLDTIASWERLHRGIATTCATPFNERFCAHDLRTLKEVRDGTGLAGR